jgi:hypothetical protein
MLKSILKLFINTKHGHDLRDPDGNPVLKFFYGAYIGSQKRSGFRHWPTWLQILTGIALAVVIVASVAAIANVVGLSFFGVGLFAAVLAPMTIKAAVVGVSLLFATIASFLAHHTTTPALKEAAALYIKQSEVKADLGEAAASTPASENTYTNVKLSPDPAEQFAKLQQRASHPGSNTSHAPPKAPQNQTRRDEQAELLGDEPKPEKTPKPEPQRPPSVYGGL